MRLESDTVNAMKSKQKKIIALLSILLSVMILAAVFLLRPTIMTGDVCGLVGYVPEGVEEFVVFEVSNTLVNKFQLENYLRDKFNMNLRGELESGKWKGIVRVKFATDEVAWIVEGRAGLDEVKKVFNMINGKRMVGGVTILADQELLLDRFTDPPVNVYCDKIKKKKEAVVYGRMVINKVFLPNGEINDINDDQVVTFSVWYQDEEWRARMDWKEKIIPLDLFSGGGQKLFYFDGGVVAQLKSGEDWRGIIQDKMRSENIWDEEYFYSYLKSKYAVDSDMLNTFFKHPLLVVLKAKKEIVNKEEIFKGDTYELVLVYEQEKDKSNQELTNDQVGMMIKNFMTNYLAFQFPMEREKELPDGTRGKELIASPESVSWDEMVYFGGVLSKVSMGEYDFAYYSDSDKVVMGVNEETVKRVAGAMSLEAKPDNHTGADLVFDARVFGFDKWCECERVWVTEKGEGVEMAFE